LREHLANGGAVTAGVCYETTTTTQAGMDEVEADFSASPKSTERGGVLQPAGAISQ
jgi:hypothetical protein